ncbi:MAG TPA: glycosyltransferase [Candidatus Sulfotelmatobacter sp.]|nr:glycosyltransferase [Candidatus Sulfotelmatobacter sp.]
MSVLAASVATLTAVTWSYLALARGSFWRIKNAKPDASDKAGFSGAVVAVIPARNEAELIGPVVTSLLNQCAAMPVLLVDDASSDGTADVARRAAEKAGKVDALIVIQSKPLPAGWTGKLWSMHQGIERARASNPAWLLLADADVVQGAETVANLGLIASEGHYDLVSFMVTLHCESLAEKLLIPAFVYFFFMLYPPAWIRDTRRSTAGAAGGCMLVRADTLERAGGLEAIRGALIDDCSLARLLKQHGGRLWIGLSDQSQSLRRFETFSDVEHMVSRTAFNQLKHSPLLLLCTIAGMVITYLAPPLLLLTRSRLAIFMGAAAWAAMTMTYSTMVRYYRLNPACALTLPLAALFYLGATMHSALKYWNGSGGDWKGRVQDVQDRQISET